MVDHFSSLCHCFGFKPPKANEEEDGKKLPLKKRKHYNYKRSISLHEYGVPRIAIHESQEELLLSYKKNQWTHNKDSKIMIIGAGEAGIHMASILIRSGFHDVTIIEQHNTFGGKSMLNDTQHSPRSDGFADTDSDIIYELGCSGYIHSNFDAFFELMSLYEDEPLHTQLVPVSSQNCNVVTNRGASISAPSKPHSHSLRHGHKRQHSQQRALHAHQHQNEQHKLKAKRSIQKADEWMNLDEPHVVMAIKKYIKLHRAIFGDYENDSMLGITASFPSRPKDMAPINMSFMQFVKKHSLQILIPYFVYNHSLLHGYGHIDEIPAFYGLLWNNVGSMKALLKSSKTGSAASSKKNEEQANNLWSLKRGVQHLFANIIDREGIQIRYNTQITSINRYLNEEKHKICLMYTEKEDTEGYEKLLECDVLFCAMDISHILPLISDATEEEKTAFSGMEAHTLCTTLFEYNPQSPIQISDSVTNHANLDETDDDESRHSSQEEDDDEKDILLSPHQKSIDLQDIITKECTFYPDNLKSSKEVENAQGHVFKLRSLDHAGMQKFIAYQMVNKMEPSDCDDEMLQATLLSDLKQNGFNIRNVEVLKQNKMRFCPSWTQNDINQGLPWLVKEKLQGKYKNMYYIGPSVCFQSIESVLEYNIQLQQKLNLS